LQTAPVCSHCGTPAETGEAFCGECGQTLVSSAQEPLTIPMPALPSSQNWTSPLLPAQPPQKISTYLVPAIFSIFFCWPLAIPAIIFAAQVSGKVAAGDIQGARDASKKAKMFSFIGLGLGLLVILIYVALFLLAIIGSIGHR